VLGAKIRQFIATSANWSGKSLVLRLSIVIPCAREPGHFEATLASVLQNRPHACEVLVVQPRRYDDPYKLRDEVRFIRAPAKSSLIDLMNLGIAESIAPIVHLLSCQVEAVDGWADPALEHFQDPTIGSVSPLVVTKDTERSVVSRGVEYLAAGRRHVHHDQTSHEQLSRAIVAPTLAAGLFRRQAVLDAGGFCPELGYQMADVDLGLMLAAAGYRAVHEEASVVTTERLVDDVPLSIAAGRAAEAIFWRNATHGDWTTALVGHPLVWLRELLSNLHRPAIALQMLGRLWGWRERGRQRAHRTHLQTLRAQSEERRQQLAPLGSQSPTRPRDSSGARAAA
jgi:hypothetical protein